MLQLLYADSKGRMYDHPNLLAGGRTGNLYTEISEADAIPLPEGASLVMIPGGCPVGLDRQGKFTVCRDVRGVPAFAVGALLPQGYTRTLLPAYRRADQNPLPLFGYAATGFKNGDVYVAAVSTDKNLRWNPVHYSAPELGQLVKDTGEEYKHNRIIRQLGQCAMKYHCFTAQNIFYRRWEGGIPVSPSCNASCLGCISLQPAECCPSPQSRIDFKPSAGEILEIAAPHLAGAEDGIISFGQGCEGEPSLAADTVSEAIIEIRRQTGDGTINMNTNAGYTEGIKKVCLAGIDSLRVSTISAREATYNSYYSPRGYNWENVGSSIAIARAQGVYVSLNLLTFPGLTDLPEEAEAIIDFVQKYNVNMVQIRNLNIDPDYLAGKILLGEDNVLGISNFIEILKTEIPSLEVGNYTKPLVK